VDVLRQISGFVLVVFQLHLMARRRPWIKPQVDDASLNMRMKFYVCNDANGKCSIEGYHSAHLKVKLRNNQLLEGYFSGLMHYPSGHCLLVWVRVRLG